MSSYKRFVQNLYEEACKPDGELVAFSSNGLSLRILNKEKLPGSVLAPKAKQYTNFQRQLNLHGFTKCKGDYANPHFTKSGEHLHLIKRNTDPVSRDLNPRLLQLAESICTGGGSSAESENETESEVISGAPRPAPSLSSICGNRSVAWDRSPRTMLASVTTPLALSSTLMLQCSSPTESDVEGNTVTTLEFGKQSSFSCSPTDQRYWPAAPYKRYAAHEPTVKERMKQQLQQMWLEFMDKVDHMDVN